MKRIRNLFLLWMGLSFFACSDSNEDTLPIDNSLFGIEYIQINGHNFGLKENSFLIDADQETKLVVTGTSYSNSRITTDYTWWNSSEKSIQSVYLYSKNEHAQVRYEEKETDGRKTYCIIVSLTKPVAEVRYTITALFREE